ncbi:MAG: molybdopterin-dependent oxidoreductase [Novosphingobium sp.]|nr:molybdopterin-dependent oxidoreductase [Novosphingobium sp.]
MAENEFTQIAGADGQHRTYCRLCEAQCGLVVEVRDGQIEKIGPDRDHPVSEGHVCIKGTSFAAVTCDPDRVLTPLKRVGGPGEFTSVSWEEALDDIAERLQAIVDRHGGAAIGSYKGNPASFATLHSTYGALFLKALGGFKNFNAVQIDTGAKNLAQELVFGSGTDWTFPDIENADMLIMIGANPLVSHMSLIAEPRFLQKLDRIAASEGVVVIDPRRTETAHRYEHVPVMPDSDAWLVGAMIHHLFEAGLEDRDVLEARSSGWEQLREALKPLTPELAESRCGVSADTIRSLAERFARTPKAACYGRVGTNRGRFGTLVNLLIESLNVVAGKFGRDGGWITGLAPIGKAGERPLHPRYGSMRSRIGDLPLVLGSTPGGSLAAEITTPGEGQMRALFVDSGNPVLAYPDGEALSEALEQLDLLVGIDFYINETTRHAHYVLPSLTFLEREDITDYWVRNAPRPWVQFSTAVIEPQGEARHEFDIYNAILARMGLPALFSDPEARSNEAPGLMEVADRMLRIGPFGDQFGENPDGLTIEKLRGEHPSGARTAERFEPEDSWSRVWTDDAKAQLWHEVTQAEIARLLGETDKQEDKLLLFGRRKLGSLNSWMHNVERLVRNEAPTLMMHPDDAAARGFFDGQAVRISTPTGSVEALLEVTDEVVPGAVCYPHGFGHKGGWQRANDLPGVNINLIASSRPEDWEQVSGNVHVDGFPVSVEAA